MKKLVLFAMLSSLAGAFLTGCVSAREQQNPQPKTVIDYPEWDPAAKVIKDEEELHREMVENFRRNRD